MFIFRWLASKIAVKLIAGFVVIALLSLVVGVVGMGNLTDSAAVSDNISLNVATPLGQLVLMDEAYQKSQGYIYNAFLVTTPEERSDLLGRIEAKMFELTDNLEKYAVTATNIELGEDTSVEMLRSQITQFQALYTQIFQLLEEDNHDEALMMLTTDADYLRTQIDGTFTILRTTKTKIATDTAKANTETKTKANRAMLGLSIGAVFVAIGLGIVISLIVTRPIKRLMTVADKIADGDLDVEIKARSQDEIGVLTRSFMRMADNVNEVMTNISCASEEVAAGAKQLSESSFSLARGATVQASSVEQLTASLEEISSQTGLNAENADKANTLSESTKINAIRGNEEMNQMVVAMQEINEASEKISGIIKVIDGIAFQTNILALNAAVEAARAGQHGRGFAVVADEVRKLAGLSANAAKESTAMMKASLAKVEEGTKIASHTADVLTEIVDNATQTADLVATIARASSEQSLGINQVNQGVLQVSQVVQSNSANAEESAASSEELASQAQMLEQQVDRFKLKKKQQDEDAGEQVEDVQKLLNRIKELEAIAEGNKKAPFGKVKDAVKKLKKTEPTAPADEQAAKPVVEAELIEIDLEGEPTDATDVVADKYSADEATIK